MNSEQTGGKSITASQQTISSNISVQLAQTTKLKRESLLRATTARAVLRFGGRVLQNSVGCASTFELSRVVAWIDEFLSHSWSQSPRRKYVMACVHFNLRISLGVVVVSCLGILLLNMVNAMPFVVRIADGELMTKGFFLSTVIIPLVFMVSIIFIRDLPLKLRGPAVFFDKCCIHQTDQDLKLEGIQGLAAFILKSRSMTIFYNDNYFSRLWTVYEVAAMLILNPDAKLRLLPPTLPSIILGGSLVLAIPCCLTEIGPVMLGNTAASVNIALAVSALSGIVLAFFVLRTWAQQRRSIEDKITAFDCKTAACAVESDRAIVHQNIQLFMRGNLPALAECDDDELLEEFNKLVKWFVPDAILATFGRVGLSYYKATSICIVGLSGLHVDRVAMCAHAYSEGTVTFALLMHRVLHWASDVLVFFPYLALLIAMVADWSLKRGAFLGVLALIVVIVNYGVILFVTRFTRSNLSLGTLLIFGICNIPCMAAIRALTRRPHRKFNADESLQAKYHRLSHLSVDGNSTAAAMAVPCRTAENTALDGVVGEDSNVSLPPQQLSHTSESDDDVVLMVV